MNETEKVFLFLLGAVMLYIASFVAKALCLKVPVDYESMPVLSAKYDSVIIPMGERREHIF